MKRLLFPRSCSGCPPAAGPQEALARRAAPRSRPQVLDAGDSRGRGRPKVRRLRSVTGRDPPAAGAASASPSSTSIVLTHAKDQRFELAPPDGARRLRAASSRPASAQDRARRLRHHVRAEDVRLRARAAEAAGAHLRVSTRRGGPAARRARRRRWRRCPLCPRTPTSKGADLFDFQPPTEVPIRSWRLLYVLLRAARGGGWAGVAARQAAAPPASRRWRSPSRSRRWTCAPARRWTRSGGEPARPGPGAGVLLPPLGDPPRLPRRALRLRRARSAPARSCSTSLRKPAHAGPARGGAACASSPSRTW